MKSEYVLINVQRPTLISDCKSHSDIPAEHLFGNTNWVKMETDNASIVSFQCQQCLQIRTYKRLTEKTLL